MKKFTLALLALSFILTGCIKDDIIEDFVEPTIRITTIPDTILLNSQYQFEYIFLNNVGIEESVNAEWSSSNPEIIEINNNGLAQAKSLGSSEISISYFSETKSLTDIITVNVGNNTVEGSIDKSGSIQTTSSYVLEGDFSISEDNESVTIEFFADYKASRALPGLYVYLSNNQNVITNALEIGKVETFEGAHSYTIDGIGINDYQYLVYFCKPFNVKVGDGIID